MRILHSDTCRARHVSLTVGVVAVCLTLLVIQLSAADPKATVRIVAVDTFGSYLPFRVVGFKDDSGHEFASRFDKSVAVGIPFGTYWVHVQCESLGPIRRQVLVSHDYSFIVLASTRFHIDYLPGKAPILKGSIKSLPTPTHGTMWIKLYGIYLDGDLTAEVDPNGEFRVVNLTPGSFLISVMNESGLLMSGKVDVRDPGAKLLLDLRDSSIRTEPDRLDAVP